MITSTLWRKFVYEELSQLTLHGKILDIGGSSKLGYLDLIGGKHTIDINNIDEKYGYTLKFDLEFPWPLANESYDDLLAINVLEHIFNYRHVLNESCRVLKPKGKIVIAVPFLMPIHPCPHDYWRFTEETLRKILKEAGFENIKVKSAGSGIFSATTNLRYNVLRHVPGLWIMSAFFSRQHDRLLQAAGHGKNFGSKNYPLGYIVTANKK
jgi:SAM-dependent methyltransferase